jgi:hypothetical protein
MLIPAANPPTAYYGIPGIVIDVRHTPLEQKFDLWTLLNPVCVTLSDGTELYIPAGYVTDFASVPQALWSVLPPIGWHNLAALVHDYLYDNRYRNGELGEYAGRLFADQQYRYFLKLAEPHHWLKRTLHYWGVRLGGRKWWNAGEVTHPTTPEQLSAEQK